MASQIVIERIDELGSDIQKELFLMRSAKNTKKQTAAINKAVTGLYNWRQGPLAGLAAAFAETEGRPT